jgi:hypothetical protein
MRLTWFRAADKKTIPAFGRRGEQIREGEIAMFKKALLMLALVGTFSFGSTQDANAWIVRRVAPVRRVVARTVLPPYPIARRAIVGPVYRPVFYGPAFYGPSVYVGF